MEKIPLFDVYIFTVRLIEAMGVQIDRNKLSAALNEVARGELTLSGSMEEELATTLPEHEDEVRALYQSHALGDMTAYEQIIAHKVLKGMPGAPAA